MQKGYSPSDYLYASARVRALEAKLPAKEQLGAVLGGGNPADLVAALFEAAGVAPAQAAKYTDTEEAMTAILEGAMKVVCASVPDPGITRLVALPYDAHNVKVYLKCEATGQDPLPLAIDLGTLPAAPLFEALRQGDVSRLAPHTGRALHEAKEAYAKTADPREIDFLIDRALYRDLAAEAADFPFAAHLFAAKTDLSNILIFLRLKRGNKDTAEALFSKSFLPGGTLDEAFFTPLFDEDEASIAAAIAAKTPYGKVVENAEASTLSALEKRADDYVTHCLAEAKKQPFGPEIPLCYLLLLEGLLKNLRIVLLGRAAGLAGDTLLSRVRESYV